MFKNYKSSYTTRTYKGIKTMIFLENNQDLISTKFYDASDGVWPGVAMLGLDFQKSPRSSDFIWCAYDRDSRPKKARSARQEVDLQQVYVRMEVGFKRFVDQTVVLVRFWCDCVASGQVFVMVKGVFPSCGRSSFPFSR